MKNSNTIQIIVDGMTHCYGNNDYSLKINSTESKTFETEQQAYDFIEDSLYTDREFADLFFLNTGVFIEDANAD